MHKFPLWEELPYFFQLAESHSLRQAAEMLRISASTLSRRIRKLEDAIGTPLFLRQPDSMRLTLAGEALLSRCRDIARIVQDLGDIASAPDAVPTIRMTSIPCFATHLVLPSFEAFQKSCGTRINLELDTSPEVSELSRQPFDIAVRLSRPEIGRYHVRRIGEFDLVLVHGPAFDPAAHDQMPLVVWDSPTGTNSRFNHFLTEIFPDNRPAVTATNYQIYVETLRANCGVGILPAYALPHLGESVKRMESADDGRLPQQDVWLVTRTDSLRQPLLREFSNHLAKIWSGPTASSGRTRVPLPIS